MIFRNNYEFLFFCVGMSIIIIIFLFILFVLLDIRTGIDSCKNAGYDGIKFVSKYSFEWVCA